MSILNAITSGSGGVALSGDTSGNLTIQSAGTNVATFNASTGFSTPNGLITNGSVLTGALGANSVFIDNDGAGTTRFRAYGTNTSTLGAFSFQQVYSNNTGTNVPISITNGGYILMNGASQNGQLSLASSSSAPAFSINNSGSGFPIEAQVTTSSYTGPGVRSRVTSNTPANTFQAYSYYNDNFGNYMFYVQGTGNVQNTNNSYGAISDVKLKENIVDATPKLSDLMKVQVRQYNLKSDQTLKQIGVIAQELETIFPGMIEETADRDVDNNDLGTTSKAVKYSVFVPILIKAMQELNAKVDAQAAEIAALKGAK
jgi:hypothetical protein